MLPEKTTPREESPFSRERVLQILRRRMWSIVLVVVVVTASTLGFSLYQEPTYEASVKLLVGQQSPGGPNLAGDVGGLQEVTLTVAEGLPTRRVAEGVVEQLDRSGLSAREVVANMSVEPKPGTMFIDVSYKDSGPASDLPQTVQLIANTLGEVGSKEISDAMLGAKPIKVRVWQEAALPETPVSPHPVRTGIIALLLGGLLGVGLAFLLEYLDNSWNSPEEVEEVSGVPTFGVIPTFAVSAGKRPELLVSKKEGEVSASKRVGFLASKEEGE
jgi:capsular polysaccharide biosynthesis protein